MEKLKLALLSIVTLSLLGLVGYWSVVTLQSGTEYATNKKVKELQKENEDLKNEVKKLTGELGTLKSKLEVLTPNTEENTEEVIYKYQSLMDELQKLVDKNVSLKQKSRGGNVGTLQKFLNIYNETSSSVDNDYGASTKTAVEAFQKAEGLTADGEAGPGTFKKMIDWLKEQG